jgi:hypothetical protein
MEQPICAIYESFITIPNGDVIVNANQIKDWTRAEA